MKFPNESIFKDKSLIRHFIRGYFDGDGCLGITLTRNSPFFEILGTKHILNSISKYLFVNKIYSNHNSKYTYILKYSGTKAVVASYLLYDNATIYLDRKYKKFLGLQNCRF